MTDTFTPHMHVHVVTVRLRSHATLGVTPTSLFNVDRLARFNVGLLARPWLTRWLWAPRASWSPERWVVGVGVSGLPLLSERIGIVWPPNKSVMRSVYLVAVIVIVTNMAVMTIVWW